MHFRGLFGILSAAGASLAASLPRGSFPPVNVAKIIDAASYNGTVVSADLPSPGRRDALQKRDAGNVYLCTAANWEQYCVYITDAGPGECVNLAGDLNDLVSSFGPDPNQFCNMFRDFDCTGSEVGPIRAPGISDLSQPINLGEGGGVLSFNDVLSSYADGKFSPKIGGSIWIRHVTYALVVSECIL
ncbi:hypothetical protein FB451DRAFT_1180062 [Mycena latifolia]|nr:hypothetical protein FB451DRAFT_1180062 [Mycena latifolia]